MLSFSGSKLTPRAALLNNAVLLTHSFTPLLSRTPTFHPTHELSESGGPCLPSEVLSPQHRAQSQCSVGEKLSIAENVSGTSRAISWWINSVPSIYEGLNVDHAELAHS